MILENVGTTFRNIELLYELLAEREPHQNISHKSMPTFQQHVQFVLSKPYEHWFMVCENHAVVGAIYLTKQDEIGVFIFKAHRGRGYAKQAIDMLMQKCPRPRFFANVNPSNADSRALFESMGGKLIQVTYEL